MTLNSKQMNFLLRLKPLRLRTRCTWMEWFPPPFTRVIGEHRPMKLFPEACADLARGC